MPLITPLLCLNLVPKNGVEHFPSSNTSNLVSPSGNFVDKITVWCPALPISKILSLLYNNLGEVLS